MTIVDEREMHPDFGAQVPQSKGMPPFLPWLAAVGLIGIFAIAAGVVFTSGHGHLWPAEKVQRIDLNSSK